MKVDFSSLPDSDAGPALAHQAMASRRAAVRIDRAATELRRGRPIGLSAGDQAVFALAVETRVPALWSQIAARGASDPAGVRLLLSAERATAAGWAGARGGLLVLTVAPEVDPQALASLAGLDPTVPAIPAIPSIGALPSGVEIIRTVAGLADIGHAAIELARLARLVPAVLIVAANEATAIGPAVDRAVLERAAVDRTEAFVDVLDLDAADLAAFASDRAVGLVKIAEAPVPLTGHESCRFVLFRESTADIEHVAIVVGTPDVSAPVTVRLHSSCLTGDLFGSLRCDCGDQLRGAVARLASEGGGVLLYLAQEGRGIGLANKLRAYTRQDAGLDTIDADRTLGFRGDERRFAVAARMLRDLGIGQVRLLTNNPTKIAALVEAGITVAERLPIGGAVTAFNARYIATKRDRAGHLFDAAAQPIDGVDERG